MDPFSLIAGFFTGAFLLLVISLFYFSKRMKETNAELIELRGARVGLEEKLSSKQRELETQQKTFDSLKETLKVEIENSNRSFLEENTNKLNKLSKQNFEEIVKPVEGELKGLRDRIQEVYSMESKERVSLKTQIEYMQKSQEQMMKAQEKLSLNADSLTHALRGDVKTQGDWGEIRLERLLEQSGLSEGREWIAQGKGLGLKSEDGSAMKPDVVVLLPEKRNVVIDSKTSLTGYYKYIESEDLKTQETASGDFLTSVHRHIRELSEKDYQHLAGINSPDFVLMFMPTDGALSFAMSKDPELYQKALNKNIMLTSPSFLSPLLRTIELIWRQEKQSKNVMDIATRGGALYDKFVGFLADLENVGKKLGEAQVSYDSAWAKLSGGTGNIIGQVEKLKTLGAKAKKSIPDKHLTHGANA